MAFEEEKEDGEVFDYLSTLFREQEEKVWPSLDGAEEILEYKFKDKELLKRAFTHHSFYSSEKPNQLNESLAFLGDSTLNSMVTKELFLLYPDFDPGELTKLRAANVHNEKLARVAIKYGLHQYLRHKNSKLDGQIRVFKEEILKYPMEAVGLIEVPKFLADTVESVIGAVLVDNNFSTDIVWKVFKKLLMPMTTPETLQMHPKTELLEFCQKNRLKQQILKYITGEMTTADVFIDGKLIATTTYCRKKEIVENRAAKKALNHLKVTFVGANETRKNQP